MTIEGGRSASEELQIVADGYDWGGIGLGWFENGLGMVLNDVIEKGGGGGVWRERAMRLVVETSVESMQDR